MEIIFTLFFTIITTYNLFLITKCDKIKLQDLKFILSKNSSKEWLENLTILQDSDNPYCKICCINIATKTIGKHCGSHTMCKYPTSHTGDACKGYIQISFTQDEKQALLDAHNTLRNIVASGKEKRGNPGPQPPASNMRALEWNVELTMIAERWAAQCIYGHDICRDLERFPVGQNIAYGNLATNNELSFIKEWYDEVKNFNSKNVASFDLQNCSGSYTQLVWADTYQIGCARAVFQQVKGSKINYREHLICNYGPTGNIPEQSVYNIGQPCSSCPEGTRCMMDYPFLCSGDNVINLIDEKRSEETLHSGINNMFTFLNIFRILVVFYTMRYILF